MNLLRANQSWLMALIFVFLPLQPEFFAGILIVIGLSQLWISKNWLLPPYLLFLSTGLIVLSQILGQNYFIEINPKIIHDNSTNNWIDWKQQFEWRGFEPKVYVGPPGAVRDGFVYLSRANPQTKTPYTALLTPAFPAHSVTIDQPITFSFYLKSTRDLPTFWIGFWVKRGSAYPVQPEFISVAPNLWRVVATFAPSKPETLDRIALEGIKGNWKELGLSGAQLWSGTNAITFSLNAQKPSRLESILRWGAQILMTIFLIHGSIFLLKQIERKHILFALLLGFALHTSIALFQFVSSATSDSRVAGLTTQPNFLGHMGIASAALLILLGDWAWGFAGLFLAGILTFLTGSRAALLGLVGLVLFWLASVPARFRIVFVAGIFLVGILVLQPWHEGGRLTDIANLNYFTTQARLQTWKVAREAIPENLWFGIGLDNFRYLYLNHRPEGAVEAEITHAHDLFLQLLVGSGIVGFSGFLLLWGWVILRLVRLNQWQVIVVIFIVVLINLVDYTWFTAGIYSALWLAIAFGLQYHQPVMSDN